MHDYDDDGDEEVADCVSDLVVEIMERQLPREGLELVLATLPHVLVRLHVVEPAISSDVILHGAQLGEEIANGIKSAAAEHVTKEAIARAIELLQAAPSWFCLTCREENAAASVACHQCGADRPR